MNNNDNFDKKPKTYYRIEKDLMFNNELLKLIYFIILILIVGVFIVEKGITDTSMKFSLFLIGLWGVIALLLNLKKWYYTRKDITKTGVKVEGYIEGFSMRQESLDTDSNVVIEVYRLTISYIDPNTNQKKEFITPDINFNPVKELSSRKCNVWVDGKSVYATDFLLGNNLKGSIWEKDDPSIIKLQKKYQKYATIDFIILLLFIILVLLFIFS